MKYSVILVFAKITTSVLLVSFTFRRLRKLKKVIFDMQSINLCCHCRLYANTLKATKIKDNNMKFCNTYTNQKHKILNDRYFKQFFVHITFVINV